jgi:hypothetical protein
MEIGHPDRKETAMNHPHIAQICSLASNAVGEHTVDDASADFGPGAVVVTCACGAWFAEDPSGELIAWSESVEVALLELSGAA